MSNMVVRTNIFALNAHRNLKNVGLDQVRASQRLSSGYRINTAADDAAGLAISETMRAQIRGLDQASRNAQDAQALITTTEGGLQEITNMIQRARELTVQASNDTQVSINRNQISYEIGHLAKEIAQMRTRVEFNTRQTLNMSVAGSSKLHFQIGANAGQAMVHDFENIYKAILCATNGLVSLAEALGLRGIDTTPGTSATIGSANTEAGTVMTTAGISALLSNIQEILDDINIERAQLGALVNRLDYTMRSLDVSSENLSDSESRIRNADMAREMMRFTKSQVLQQAGVSMLAQANNLPNNLLQLLN